MALHLLKLCVGCDTVDDLLAWRRETSAADKPWVLRTRQTPKRAAELTDGGSLYRVYKGFILSRQPILEVRTVGEGAARLCEMILSETVTLTLPTPRRAVQGWRYLEPAEAPDDLRLVGETEALPLDLTRRLRDIGAW